MADTTDSKSVIRKYVGVQVPPPAFTSTDFMRPHILFLVVAFIAGSSAYGFPNHYDFAAHAQAEAEAQLRHLPLAWVGGFPEQLDVVNPDRGGQTELTQMALVALQDRAVVIFFEGDKIRLIPILVHMQFHQQDDGPLPGGANWDAPKVVFTDPAVTKALGRVSATQMRASREAAIYLALQAIQSDPAALQPLKRPPLAASPPASATPADAEDSAPSDGYDTRFGKIPMSPELANFLSQNRDTLIKVAIGLVVLWILMRLFRRRS
jgi:hypothetical protein